MQNLMAIFALVILLFDNSAQSVCVRRDAHSPAGNTFAIFFNLSY